MTEPGSAPSLPEIWPEWIVEEELGQGANSVVWQACHRDQPRMKSAIKVIEIKPSEEALESFRKEHLTEEQIRARYRQLMTRYSEEIQKLGMLKGTSHIVSMEDFAVVPSPEGYGARIFIRMELLKPLKNYLCDKQLSEEEVIRIGTDLCEALEVCHAEDLVHRDIKPENILVNDRLSSGTLFKLADFGLAEETKQFSSESPAGTISYMAPEVYNHTPTDLRADLYSLGLTLYTLMNRNRLPFLSDRQFPSHADRALAFKARVSGVPFPPLSSASEAFTQVILKACAFQPEARFQSATEMKQALQALLTKEKGNSPSSDRNSEASVRKRRIHPLLILLAGLLLAGLLFWLFHAHLSGSNPGILPETTPVPLLPVTNATKETGVLTRYSLLQSELDHLSAYFRDNSMFHGNTGTVRVPVDLARSNEFLLHLADYIPEFTLDLSSGVPILTMMENSREWHPLIEYEDYSVVSFQPEESGHAARLKESEPQVSRKFFCLHCVSRSFPQVQLIMRFDPDQRNLLRCSFGAAATEDTSTLSLDIDYHGDAPVWTLFSYPKSSAQMVSSWYNEQGKLQYLERGNSRFEFHGTEDHMEGVEWIP